MKMEIIMKKPLFVTLSKIPTIASGTGAEGDKNTQNPLVILQALVAKNIYLWSCDEQNTYS